MKKIVILLLFILAAIGIWFYLNRNPQPSAPSAIAIKGINASTNSSKVIIASSNNVASSVNVVAPTNEMINALTATNLDQWKSIIKDLHKSTGFQVSKYWDMTQTNRTASVPVLLAKNGQSVLFKANFVDISVTGGTNIMEVEMHSPIMNIDETRALGLELHNMLGQDPTEFLEWCDKVGNRWLDQPLFGTKGDRHLGFATRHTFNNEKPWYIDFVIQ